MPRNDDEFDDDDRPRRRPSDDDERPRRRRSEDDDDLPPRQKKKSGLGLILGIVGGALFLLFALCLGGIWWGYSKVGDAADRMHSSNNLKQISIACMNYEGAHGAFPTDSYSPEGKPLLSWRVHILPFIEQEGLYRQFKLDEPWDSPNNIRLLSQMPITYATPAESKGTTAKGNKTYYRGFTSPGTVFARRDLGKPAFGDNGGFAPKGFAPPPIGIRMMDVTDGSSNTILAVEAGDPIEWSMPGDLDASPGKPFPTLGGIRPKSDVVAVIMMDGSIRMMRKNKSESEWRALVTYNGGEIVNLE
jgi:hypothetical protein